MEVVQIILTLIASAIGIIYAKKWKELKLIPRIAVVAALLAALVTGVMGIQNYRTKKLIEKINANFGDIHDLTGATIPILQIGSSGPKFGLGDPSGIFFRTEDAILLQVYVMQKKLFVNVVVRDVKGNPLAVIDKNEWTRISKDYEYNDSETAFELVTVDSRKAVFQIELKDGIAHYSGILVDEEGYGLCGYQNDFDNGAFFSFIKPKMKFVLPPIKPIFKYPRERYYGVRAD